MATASPAHVLAQYLIAQGILGDPQASAPTWPLYINHLPDQAGVADDVASLHDVVGSKDCRLMLGHNILHFGLHLMVRSLRNQDGWSKLIQVCSALELVHNISVVISSITYVINDVSQKGTPEFTGLEEGTKRRSLFSVRFEVTIS